MADDKNKLILGSGITSNSTAIQAYMDAKTVSSNTRSNWDIISAKFTTSILDSGSSIM